jgi:signal transduction histidine kinase/CheY-like chemotaxis protein
MSAFDQPADGPAETLAQLRVRLLVLTEENALLRKEALRHAERAALVEQLREANQNLMLAAVQAQNLRDDAVASSHRQDEFLAMLAHELRNPLAPISLASALLGKLPSPTAQLRDLQAIIERQVRHLARLLDDLLDAARINNGKITLLREAVPLRELIGRAVDAVQVRMLERHQELKVDLPQAMVIEGDAVRIVQVFSNLLVNASKFTADGGVVSIHGGERRGDAIVTISDTGVGIDPAAMPHIFDLFTQGPRTLARAEGGLGVGLNVVRNIVHLHGGEVSALSNEVTGGTTFTVRLPLSGTPPPLPPPPRPELRAQRGRRILLVEDNRDASATLRTVLEGEGHTVTVAYDGITGLIRARSEPFEVLVCDIGLPGLDGMELLTRLRKENDLPIPFAIAVSGYGQAEYRTRAIVAGYGQYFVKPVDIEALLNLISSDTVTGFINNVPKRR